MACLCYFTHNWIKTGSSSSESVSGPSSLLCYLWYFIIYFNSCWVNFVSFTIGCWYKSSNSSEFRFPLRSSLAATLASEELSENELNRSKWPSCSSSLCYDPSLLISTLYECFDSSSDSSTDSSSMPDCKTIKSFWRIYYDSTPILKKLMMSYSLIY